MTGSIGLAGATGSTGATGSIGLTGATGATGASGLTGLIGATGSTGATGVVGLTGATGVTGAAGSTGLTGATGSTGYIGATGIIGLSGATGLAGATGGIGLTGASGATGLMGSTGSIGLSGATGSTGATGITGQVGATGQTGVAGATGLVGATGSTGATGLAGLDGATGLTGSTGAIGLAGATGATGATGPAGEIGSTGPIVVGATGATGSAGASGVTGSSGTHGASGLTGATGVIGATGIQGASGSDGANGASGVQGASGPQGETGATGIYGATGADGLAGATGTDGEVGLTGATGISGAAGATGSQGSTGYDGATGISGATGATGIGEIGLTGATGVTGTSGTDGASGATGADGLVGATGTYGATGYTGATGIDGASGASGATGTYGASGATGYTGATGIDGASGASGYTGATGATGLQGSTSGLRFWFDVSYGEQFTSPATTAILIYNTFTITRSSGSFIDDGWMPYQMMSITGTTYNNKIVSIAAVSALTITLSDNTENALIDETVYSTITVSGRTLRRVPPSGDEQTVTATAFTDDNVVSIGGYITNVLVPGALSAPAGTWIFTSTCFASGTDTFLKYEVLKRAVDGTTVELFTTAGSEITGRSGTPSKIVIEHLAGSDTPMASTDRIVVRVLAYTTALGVTRSITWYYQGSTRSAYIDTPFAVIPPIGATGSTGPIGATGVQGASGVGATGIDGASGASGASGATGVQGASGLDGATGIDGATGVGATGPSGTNGATGATGIAGASGPSGLLKLAHVICVGSAGDYSTIKAAVDWFNSSATSPVEILIDAGHFPVDDTIVVNNGSYELQIRGLGSEVTFVEAATGLTGKPMFNLKSNCDITKITANGSTLADYGTVSGENFITYDTNSGLYSEITDLIIDTFKIAIADLKGIDLFLFNFNINNCGTGVEINYTTTDITASQDIEIGNFVNCTTGIHLMRTGSGTTCTFYLAHLIFDQASNATSILYDGTNYFIGNLANVFNCAYNNAGTFLSGFDFALASGRDANIEVIANTGTEDQAPHCKLNVIDGTATTTITSAGTYYKANATGFNSKTRILFDLAATAGTWTFTLGDQTTAAIAYNASAATIQTTINNLSNVTSCTITQIIASQEWTIEFTTAGEGWLAQSVDISGLTTTTSVDVQPNFYTCKINLSSVNNRMIFQSDHIRDGKMWITGNLSVNNSNRNINIGIMKNANNLIISPFTVRTATSGQAYPFSIVAYLKEVKKDDFFGIWLTSGNNGDVVTLSDVYWLADWR